MDIIRQDIDVALGGLRHALAKIRIDLAEGPVHWKDDDRGSAVEHWATWGLHAARNAANEIAVLDLDARRARMSPEEQVEVDSVRAEVAAARAHFVSQGGRLLPSDLAEP